MNFSFWERDTWFSNVDYTIVGSGITGLNCALRIKERFPAAKILVLERGMLPSGASTKNAGFACFGSLSEILDDLKSHSEDEVVELIKKRVQGLQLLRRTLGDEELGLQNHGGYELFSEGDHLLFEACETGMGEVNKLLKPIFKDEVFSRKKNLFGFRNVEKDLIFNQYEGQLDTGKMMASLLRKVIASGILVLNSMSVLDFSDNTSNVEVKTQNYSFKTGKLLVATNGFASKLGFSEVRPARAQVLITDPIRDLPIKGTFHLDKGYYYFRNVKDRILLGGGRNLDFKAEETTAMEVTEKIQHKLEDLLRTTILPQRECTIAHRWSGIMGVGAKKSPVVRQVSNNVYCGVRLGGMGVAIGSLVGQDLGNLIA